jgi:hypothetical protein
MEAPISSIIKAVETRMKGGQEMRNRASLAVMAITAAVILLLAIAGCGSGGDQDGSPGKVSEGADIRGYVTSTWGISADPRPSEVLGSVRIEGELEEDTAFDRADVTVTEGTRIYVQHGSEFEEAEFFDLQVGQYVEASFTGPVAESYPVQATAAEIVVLGTTSIGEVKDRHEEELLAIPGVVGFGISSHDGEPVIVVYLESDSPQLAAAVPAELEGFRVITEVTGPIEIQPLP